MASVAAKEIASLGSPANNSAYTVPEEAPEPPVKKDIRTPKLQPKRPRTRSLVLNTSWPASSTPTKLSNREKRARDRHPREKSPVIDLTTDVDFEVPDANGESPLKNASKPRKDLPTNISRGIVGANSPQDLNDMPNPKLQHRLANNANELNLSPIKKDSTTKRYFTSLTKLPQNVVTDQLLLSSPSKRRKTVAFSDNIVSDVPSSPICGEHEPQMTPKRSILKPASEPMESSPLDPNNSTMWVKTSHTILHQFSLSSHAPNNPAFWQPGTIILLEPKSSDLLQLVDGCVEVLRIESFIRKFEVYATLNQIFKLNDANILSELFVGDGGSSNWLAMVEKSTGFKRKSLNPYITSLCEFVTRDIEAIELRLFSNDGDPKLSPSKNDPFEARSLSQALKLVSSLLAIPSINSCIPVNTVKWFYLHTCDMIVKPSISKSLVLPYLSIIKDCQFSAKKRRFIFESSPNPILERMLFALLNIRNFVSSSLVNEKFIALKNLIQKFPAITAKNFHHWFGGLVLNLCDITFPLYTKIVSTGITALLEAARNYLDNNDICLAARKLLEFPLPMKQKSFTSENLVSISTMPLTITIDYVGDSLKELIDNGHYKFAMDIWVGLTLLLGNFDNGVENWKYLQPWLQVHKYCFNEPSINAKITALASWKVIIYKVCICEFKDIRHNLTGLVDSIKNTENNSSNVTPNSKHHLRLEEVLRPKIKLLIHVFINISSVEFQREIVDTLDRSFLSILYNLLNHQQKTNPKMLLIYWDKIIQPVLMNFYFKKESSNSHMHHLGLGILNRLIKPATPVNEKSYSSIRCLSHEAVTLSEINSLNPRWIYLRFERMLPFLLTIFKLSELDTDAKIGCFNNFLNTLKFTTKKEIQPSDTTFDIVDSIPTALQAFFENSRISYDSVFKLIVNLNDTFGASNLVLEHDESPGVFDVVLANSITNLNTQQLNAILSMLHGAIGERKSLLFLCRLVDINQKFNREDLSQFVGDCLNNKKSLKFSHQDMIYVGKIFRLLDQNFAGIAKKLIQHIVLLKANEFEKMVDELGLSHWSIQIFKFFIILMHDAPFDHLKLTSLNLIKSKWQSNSCFDEIFRLLVENKFDFEIFNLRTDISRHLQRIGDKHLIHLWQDYLQSFEGETSQLDELMCVSIDLDFDIASIASNQWKNLPVFKKAFDENFGSLPSDYHSCNLKTSTNITTGVGIDAKQVELENMIQSEFRHHTAANLASENASLTKNNEEMLGKVNSLQGSNNVQNPIILSSEHDIKEPEVLERKSSSDNLSFTSKQAKRVEGSLTRRRSERLLSASGGNLKIGMDKLSMNDVAEKLPTRSDRIEKNKRGTSKKVKSINENQLEEVDALGQSENNDTETNEGSLVNSQVEEGSKKREIEETDSIAFKKQKVNEDTKQVSDSDDSLKKKNHPDHDHEMMEIISNSSNSKKSDSDSGESMGSIDCVDSQDRSVIANTSNISEAIVNPSPLKRQLSVVEEIPALESKSSSDCNEQLICGAIQSNVRLNLKAALEKVDQEELAALTFQEKYDLETAMMQFILRMRALGEQSPNECLQKA